MLSDWYKPLAGVNTVVRWLMIHKQIFDSSVYGTQASKHQIITDPLLHSTSLQTGENKNWISLLLKHAPAKLKSTIALYYMYQCFLLT